MKVKSESEVAQSCLTLHDPDNHNGVIIHLEPDILECEVGLRKHHYEQS